MYVQGRASRTCSAEYWTREYMRPVRRAQDHSPVGSGSSSLLRPFELTNRASQHEPRLATASPPGGRDSFHQVVRATGLADWVVEEYSAPKFDMKGVRAFRKYNSYGLWYGDDSE
jgi:hypothetical protein